MRPARARITGSVDGCRGATITLERSQFLLVVRPLRRRRSYALPLARVAEWVVYTVVKAELADKAAQERERSRPRRR